MSKRFQLASIPIEVRGGLFCLIGMGVSILTTLFIPWLGVLLLLLTLGLFVLGNMIVVVPAGYAAYVERLGNSYRSLKSKLSFVTPFISIVGMVPTRDSNYDGKDVTSCQWVNPKTGLKTKAQITVSYTLFYKLEETQVHLLHAKIGENDYLDSLCKLLNSVVDQIIATKDYQTDIYDKYASLGPEITAQFLKEVKEYCKGVTGTDGKIYQYLKVQVNGAAIDPKIQAILDELATEQEKLKIAETQKERKRVEAEGDAIVKDIQTKADAGYTLGIMEAQAEGMKKKGEAENEVLEKRGKVLRDHPSIIRERQAEHTPKVVVNGNGYGVMPTVSVDSFVDHDLINK